MSDLPFGFAKPEDSPGFLLWQTTTRWQRLIKKALEPHGVSHAQFVLMAALLWLKNQQAVVTQVDLIGFSGLDKMTVSQALRKLAQGGYVERSEHAKDTRAKQVALTESGKNLIQKLVPKVEAVDKGFFGKLEASNYAAFLKGLVQLTSE